jgi:hypothetical protein
MGLMALTAFSVLLQANNSLTLSYKQAYIQMARVASKAAIDYAQEQYDNSLCGNYAGTDEQTLVTNSRYKVTFKAEVLSTSSDGLSKTIRGTGSVYLPLNATNARYVFSIESEIVRTYAVCKTPSDFAPTLWLDASDTSTLLGQTSGTLHRTTGFGNAGDSTRDTLAELAYNGSQTTSSWRDTAMDLNACSIFDFDILSCLFSSTKYVNDGMIFQNVTIPANATITSATLTTNGASPSGSGGSETASIVGLYHTSTEPNMPLWSSSGSNQLRPLITTSTLHTTNTVSFTTNNLPPGNGVTTNITSIVQEMVQHTGWSSGDNLALGMQYVSGNGSRRLLKDNIALDITYQVSGSGSSTNGGSISQWNDKSGNGNHAVFGLGSAPTRVDGQINGNTVVRFNNGALLSTLTQALTNKREMTVLGVVKPNFSTSSTDGRIISGTSSTVSNDTTAGSSIIPLLRNSINSGFSSIYSGTSYRTNYTCGSSCTSTPYLFASEFQLDGSNKITGTLYGDGAQVAQSASISPPGSPYTYNINQIYVGGTRTGAMPGSGTAYLNGDYAELIVYDHALTCQQLESVEDYLRSKWNLSATAYTDTCAATTVPTL